MAKLIPEPELAIIEALVSARPGGIAMRDIRDALGREIPYRTLQYRLKHLVDAGRLIREGERRWARYWLPAASESQAKVFAVSEPGPADDMPLSAQAATLRAQLRKPLAARKPVGYNRAFLEG